MTRGRHRHEAFLAHPLHACCLHQTSLWITCLQASLAEILMTWVWMRKSWSGSVCLPGAGLDAPESNRQAWRIELMTGKPAPLDPARVRHPNSSPIHG